VQFSDPAGFVRSRIVSQNEGVFALLVLEVIVDAFFFHQPRDKVEVGFAILDAIIARLKAPVKAELEVLKLQVEKIF
jgi:hypothetical protein